MSERFRWGILGTGHIAKKFAEGLRVIPDAEVTAVGSRSRESADRFAKASGAKRSHPTYEGLAADPELDAIYVSTPHPFHCENTLLCLKHDQAVLCEKPFAINASEAESMIATARDRGLFLMEAMWTRFNPVMVRLREILAQKTIGDLRIVTADFGFRADSDPNNRLLNPALGGGALLDVGIYPISFTHMVYGGAPTEIRSLPHLGQTGVDEQSAYLFRYPDGALAVLCAAVRTVTFHEATICGTEGRIRIPDFWHPTKMCVNDEVYAPEIVGNGYNYEASEVMSCVRAGKTESDVISLDQTLAIQQNLDEIRAAWNLRYPGE